MELTFTDISSAQPQCINTSELRLTGGRRLALATTAPLPALVLTHRNNGAKLIFVYIRCSYSPFLSRSKFLNNLLI